MPSWNAHDLRMAWRNPWATVARRGLIVLTTSDGSVALRRGDGIFYVPRIREFNYRVYGIDLANYGARDLHALFLQHAERAGPD